MALLLLVAPALGQVVINEVSDKGTPDFCSGDDWIEVANADTTTTYNLTGWMLCDSDGCSDDDAYTFGEVLLGPSQYTAVCHLAPKNRTHRRWINSNDTITLHDASGTLVDTSGVLGGSGEYGKTWARSPDLTGAFGYTWAPTPNGPYAGPGSNTACDKLAREGLNCTACVDPSIDPKVGACTSTAASDYEDEKLALFGSKGPPSLWNQTEFLFKDETVWSVELILADDKWDSMRDDPAAEKYEIGKVRVSGPDGASLGEWPDVGIRFKGFFGSLRLCLIGLTTCHKLSYKLKFDYVNPNQRFFGLKRLQLHASISDTTMMRERLSYQLFREMGVPTVRQAYSVVQRVNADGSRTDRLGVYLLTEVLDGRWTDSNFRPGDGNLYKEAWPPLDGASTSQKTSYFTAQLRTNSGADAWGGTGPNVSRLIAFGDAVEAASDDYELAMAVKRWTAAKQWAKFYAIDRAADAWDGPSNFRKDDGSGATTKAWTHNFYMYEEDRANVAKREFHLVPWDMDNTWQGVHAPEQPIGNRPAFDAPVCGPSEHAAGYAGTSGCILCTPFSSTNGLSKSLPPSCFKINRAFFGLGLRQYFMDAAVEAMTGPLRMCKIRAKLNRWKASIDSAMGDDVAARLWPPQTGQDGGYTYDAHFDYFRDTQVPSHLDKFRESVACGAGGSTYKPEQWGDMYSVPVSKMLKIEGIATGAWMGGGPRTGLSTEEAAQLIGLAVVGGLIVLGALFCYRRKRGGARPAFATSAGRAGAEMMSSSTASAPSSGASEPILVHVPPGVVAGQELLIDSPHGGQMIVVVPPSCSAFTATAPLNEPASRSVSCPTPIGLNFAPSPVGGVVASQVFPDYPAAKAGIKAGERILTINGTAIPSIDAVNSAVALVKQSAGGLATLQVTNWVPTVMAYS